MKRAEVQKPWQEELEMQTDEVGLWRGDSQRKAKANVPMAKSTRKESKKKHLMHAHGDGKPSHGKGKGGKGGARGGAQSSRLRWREVESSTRGGGE